jgi:RNA polymerase sigma-32 factor
MPIALPCFSWLDVPKALFGVSQSVAQLDGDSEKFGRWLFDALAREGSCAVPHDLEQTCKTMRQAWGGSAQSLFCEHPEWEGRIGRGSRAQERLGEEVGRRRGRLAESIALKPKSQKSDSIVRNASRVEHAMGMAPDREMVLARRWREEGDEDALRELTRAYMRLSIAMAARFRRYGLSMSDLVQEANVGLMQAAARFRPERGVRFSTYAAWWIRSAVQDYVLRNWSIIRTGTTAAQKSLFFNLRRLRARMDDMDEEGVSPENRARIANELRVEESEVDAMAARLSARDRGLAGGEKDLAPLQEDRVETRGRWIAEALKTLSARELFIITERRMSEEGATLESLGRQLGVSRGRVRQIELAALEKLKAALIAAVGDPVAAGLIDEAEDTPRALRAGEEA